MKATFKFRVERQGQQREVVLKEDEVEVEPAERAPRPLAMRLALAHYVERCLDAGVIASYAEAARKLGITPARMTQIADLSLLSIEAQERILGK